MFTATSPLQTRTALGRFLPFGSHRLETRQCPGAMARTRGHPAGEAAPERLPRAIAGAA